MGPFPDPFFKFLHVYSQFFNGSFPVPYKNFSQMLHPKYALGKKLKKWFVAKEIGVSSVWSYSSNRITFMFSFSKLEALDDTGNIGIFLMMY